MTWEEKQITTENDCKACSHVRIVTCGKRKKKKKLVLESRKQGNK